MAKFRSGLFEKTFPIFYEKNFFKFFEKTFLNVLRKLFQIFWQNFFNFFEETFWTPFLFENFLILRNFLQMFQKRRPIQFFGKTLNPDFANFREKKVKFSAKNTFFDVAKKKKFVTRFGNLKKNDKKKLIK